MKLLTGTSSESQSSDRSTAGTSIRPRSSLSERDYLEREAALAKKAMGRSLGELRRAADPVGLMREHPVAAGAIIGGAAAAAVALLARSRGHTAEVAPAKCAVKTASRPRHSRLRGVGSAIGRGLLSLLVSKVFLALGDGRASDSDHPVD